MPQVTRESLRQLEISIHLLGEFPPCRKIGSKYVVDYLVWELRKAWAFFGKELPSRMNPHQYNRFLLKLVHRIARLSIREVDALHSITPGIERIRERLKDLREAEL